MPRAVVAFIAAHFSPLICTRLITTGNAVSRALAGGAPGRLGALLAVRQQIDDGGGGGGGLLFAVLAVITTFLFATVAFSFLTRLTVLVIIAVDRPPRPGLPRPARKPTPSPGCGGGP